MEATVKDVVSCLSRLGQNAGTDTINALLELTASLPDLLLPEAHAHWREALNAVEEVVGCLTHASKRIVEAALGVLVQCAPSTVGAAMMLHAGVLPVLLELLQKREGVNLYEVRRDASLVFLHITQHAAAAHVGTCPTTPPSSSSSAPAFGSTADTTHCTCCSLTAPLLPAYPVTNGSLMNGHPSATGRPHGGRRGRSNSPTAEAPTPTKSRRQAACGARGGDGTSAAGPGAGGDAGEVSGGSTESYTAATTGLSGSRQEGGALEEGVGSASNTRPPAVCTLRERIARAVREARPIPATVIACDVVLQSKIFVSSTMLRVLSNLAIVCGPLDDTVLGGGAGKAAANTTRKLMHRVCTYFLQQLQGPDAKVVAAGGPIAPLRLVGALGEDCAAAALSLIQNATEQLSAQLSAALLPAAGMRPAKPRALYMAALAQRRAAPRRARGGLGVGRRERLHTVVRPQQTVGLGDGEFGDPPSLDTSGRLRGRLRTRDEVEDEGEASGEEEGEEVSSGGEDSDETEEEEEDEEDEGEEEDSEEEGLGQASPRPPFAASHSDAPRPALLAVLHAIGHGCGPQPGSLPAAFSTAEVRAAAAGPLPGAGCGSGWLQAMRDGPITVLGRAMLCWGTLVASELVAVANVAVGVRDAGLAQALCQAGVSEGLLQAALLAPTPAAQPFASPRHASGVAAGHSLFGGGASVGLGGGYAAAPALTPAQRGLCGTAGAHLLSLALQRCPQLPYWTGGLRLRPSPLVDAYAPASSSQLAVSQPKRRHADLDGPAPGPGAGGEAAAQPQEGAVGGVSLQPGSPEAGRAAKMARRAGTPPGGPAHASVMLSSSRTSAPAAGARATRAARQAALADDAGEAGRPCGQAAPVPTRAAHARLVGVGEDWSRSPGGSLWPAGTLSERRTLRVEARHVAAKDAEAAAATLQWEATSARAGGGGGCAGAAAAGSGGAGPSTSGSWAEQEEERALQGTWATPAHAVPPHVRVKHAHRPLARALYALAQWVGSEVALLAPAPAALMSPRRDAVATPRHGAPVPAELLLAALTRSVHLLDPHTLSGIARPVLINYLLSAAQDSCKDATISAASPASGLPFTATRCCGLCDAAVLRAANPTICHAPLALHPTAARSRGAVGALPTGLSAPSAASMHGAWHVPSVSLYALGGGTNEACTCGFACTDASDRAVAAVCVVTALLRGLPPALRMSAISEMLTRVSHTLPPLNGLNAAASGGSSGAGSTSSSNTGHHTHLRFANVLGSTGSGSSSGGLGNLGAALFAFCAAPLGLPVPSPAPIRTRAHAHARGAAAPSSPLTITITTLLSREGADARNACLELLHMLLVVPEVRPVAQQAVTTRIRSNTSGSGGLPTASTSATSAAAARAAMPPPHSSLGLLGLQLVTLLSELLWPSSQPEVAAPHAATHSALGLLHRVVATAARLPSAEAAKARVALTRILDGGSATSSGGSGAAVWLVSRCVGATRRSLATTSHRVLRALLQAHAGNSSTELVASVISAGAVEVLQASAGHILHGKDAAHALTLSQQLQGAAHVAVAGLGDAPSPDPTPGAPTVTNPAAGRSAAPKAISKAAAGPGVVGGLGPLASPPAMGGAGAVGPPAGVGLRRGQSPAGVWKTPVMPPEAVAAAAAPQLAPAAPGGHANKRRRLFSGTALVPQVEEVAADEVAADATAGAHLTNGKSVVSEPKGLAHTLLACPEMAVALGVDRTHTSLRRRLFSEMDD